MDSSTDVCHSFTLMPKSSSSSSDTTALTWPAVSLPLEGLEDVYIHRFIGTMDMRKAVKSQSKLQAGESNQQCIIFRPVTENDPAKVDRVRHSIGKHIRTAHYTNMDLLIVKLMPSVIHKGTHANLDKNLCTKIIRMRMSDENVR
jgi:hypothetical protein